LLQIMLSLALRKDVVLRMRLILRDLFYSVDQYVSCGPTVNIFALDVSEAFDRMYHYGLLNQLMARRIPVNLLHLIETWFTCGVTCIKWGLIRFYALSCGIRQDEVLMPYCFAFYVGTVIDRVHATDYGCRIKYRLP